MKKIYKYIIKEFIPNYLLGFTFFSIFLLVQLLFQIVRYYVEDNRPLSDVLELLIYGIAWVISFSIPIACIMGTVLSLGRISGDSEITAMRANGIGLSSVFKPVVFMGIIVMLFNLYYYEVIYPWGMYKYYEKHATMGIKDPTTQLKESLGYSDRDSSIEIKVDRVTRDTRELINVRITSDKLNKLIIAEKGKFLDYDRVNEHFPLKLTNTLTQPLNIGENNELAGADFYEIRSEEMTIYVKYELPDKDFNRSYVTSLSISQLIESLTQKKTYNIYDKISDANFQADSLAEIVRQGADIEKIEKEIDESSESEDKANGDKEKKNDKEDNDNKENKIDYKLIINNESELSDKEKSEIEGIYKKFEQKNREFSKPVSRSTIKNIDRYNLELQKKYSYSFSCLVFVLIGAPLSVFSARSGKSYGLGISLLFIAVWYSAHFISQGMLGSFEPISFMGITIDLSNIYFRAWFPPGLLLPVAAFLWYKKLRT